MGTFVLALTLGVLGRAWLSDLIKLPYTVVVLCFGLVVGFIIHTEELVTGPDIFSSSVSLWINLSPEAILTVILPILIFGTSFASDLHLFMKQIVPVSRLTLTIIIIVIDYSMDIVSFYDYDGEVDRLIDCLSSLTSRS